MQRFVKNVYFGDKKALYNADNQLYFYNKVVYYD